MKPSSFGATGGASGDTEIVMALMECMNEAVFVIDPYTMRILDVNGAATAKLGYSLAEMTAITLDRILPGCYELLRNSDSTSAPIEKRLAGRDSREVTCALVVRRVRHRMQPAALVIARESVEESNATSKHHSVATSAATEEREDLIETNLTFPSIIGQSSKIREVCRLIGLVARTDATVLIQGESGTGKELVAQAVHFHSRRNNRPLIKVNCAALAETLLESEFFGHKRGAFTGAIQDRKGRFKLADGGTIILDEVDSLSPAGQAKLLRVLQEKEFEAIGDSTTVKVDVRVAAITNANIEKHISGGRFREDLYYRLNAFPIYLPPLRERPEDIPFLARHFVRRYAAPLRKPVVDIDLDALTMLMNYSWPGNVRELENTIEYAVILEKEDTLSVRSLPDKLARREKPHRSLKRRLEVAEKQILLETLSTTNGAKKLAANLLGIDRRNFSYFLNKHGIRVSTRFTAD